MKPTREEVATVVNILDRHLSTRFINILIDESKSLYGIEQILGEELCNKSKLRLLINQKEARLFAGSQKRTIELRKKLLETLPNDQIEDLFGKFGKTKGASLSHKIGQLSQMNWHNGKCWPSTFTNLFDFPKVFSGIKREKRLPTVETIEPLVKLPPLRDFQIELKNKLKEVLSQKGNKVRCIVSLPTGGGKTRTAVEAFIEWLQPRFEQGLYLIWIAQSEELCEQAIECIRQQWSSKEFPEALRIYRFFGSTTIEAGELEGGVVVSSIQQLNARLGKREATLTEIVKNAGAIIIDEAHRATTSMYKEFFNFCLQEHSEELFPICGLTATPGRSFNNTEKLVNVFESELFTPVTTLGAAFKTNPLEYFRAKKYLARPIHKSCNTQVTIGVPANESINQFKDRLQKQIQKQLAKNKNRNKLIVRDLLGVPKGKQSIVYACTVDHAEMLATVLNYYGRRATAISAKTPRHYRRKLIEQFKNGDIEFIMNYGVLTTGFDAPKTEYIFICRPTFSEVLYEQIVGRGLRGPVFGGTETCNIVDYCDNYERFGDQQAYKRFENFWK